MHYWFYELKFSRFYDIFICRHAPQTDKQKIIVAFSCCFFYLALAHAGQRVQESIATLPHTPLSLRVKRSNPVNYARTRMRATLL